jgi:GNAT superfamily N-acetyltransferase
MKTQSVEDRRAQNLVLTSAGKRTFTILDRAADDQARRLFSKLSYEQALTLNNALRTVQLLLDPNFANEPISIREQRVGDLGWAFYRQAAVYKHEFHYNDAFEAHVCRGLSPFLEKYEPKKDHLWVGELGSQPVGFIAVQHVAKRPGWAQLRWFFVEKEARGHGLGSRLLEKAIAFCKKSGYKGIFLWTVSNLDSARELYKKSGFRLKKDEKQVCSWAPWAREQCWELYLQNEPA